MASYRITQGDFQARFDPLGRLTHLGHPDHIKDQPTCFHTTGPVREGHWLVNCGRQDIFFDPETTRRVFDLQASTLTLTSSYRGPCEWYGLDLVRTYRIEQGLLRCDFTLSNWSPIQPQSQAVASDGSVISAAPIRRLRYCTGVNCWTDYSSDWAHRPYPTNLRCEQDFFWGAAISPAHDVIGFFSASKADSWHVMYEDRGMQRIRSFCIDFVNSLDLHPDRWQHQEARLGGTNASYSGAFYAGTFASLEAFFQKAADVLGVAFCCPDRCAGFEGETLRVPVIRPHAAPGINARVRDESSGKESPPVTLAGTVLPLPLRAPTGHYTVTLAAGGKSTEARFWRHRGWVESLQVAAHHAATSKRPSGHNAESCLGLITLAQAAGLLGDTLCRETAHAIIEDAYRHHFDRVTGRHRAGHDRLQNYGSFLDAIRIYHQRLGTTEFLADAQRSARQLMSLQHRDGNFYNHHNIYNNVIHPVKSLFDWGQHLRAHGQTADADEIFASVEKAYRAMARFGDDTQTEGSDHFEDGMTACSGYQIASLWPHYGRKPEDLATARAIYLRRRALKSRVPDSRYFGATLRHWEGYWAMGLGECMLGGHGWNAWSASLAHALFMATGEWHYLLDAYATLTNCMQSVDLDRGLFHFGFSIDPCWHDFYGLGSQHPGERYEAIPDEITISCESHSAFLTLDDSFYRQTYLRLLPQGVEILNGRLLRADTQAIELESYALDLKEIVIVRDSSTHPLPRIQVAGKAPRLIVLPVP